MRKFTLVAKKCSVCNKKFIPTGRNQKYCSANCKAKLYSPEYWVHKTLASRRGEIALSVYEFAEQLKKSKKRKK
jgi:hypothetical protein